MNKKSKLGQFFTTNYAYILNGMYIPQDTTHIIEPFAGNCDLLKFITNIHEYNIECYDIDPKTINTIEQDTLNNPPVYKNKFVITNPPYLSRNKSINKTIFDKYKENDLYKCFLRTLIMDQPDGGIIIVPLNFWSSIRKLDVCLRRDFLNIYHVLLLNIFEEQVFDDTTYTVCCFQFKKKESSIQEDIKCVLYPTRKELYVSFNQQNNYTIGGEIYQLPQSNYIITRLTRKNIESQGITNIVVKTIDDSMTSRIRTSMVADKDRYIDNTTNLTERSYATLVIIPAISLQQQLHLVNRFNILLEEYRNKYNSLFLCNYREGSRKRISFELVYIIISHLLLDTIV